MRALVEGDPDASRALLRSLRDVLRRDFLPASISMFDRRVTLELRRDDATRMLAMSLMVLGTNPCVTSPEEKLRLCNAVEEREWVFVRSFLASLPDIVAKHLRCEPNLQEFVLEARTEMALCAPLWAVVTLSSKRETGDAR